MSKPIRTPTDRRRRNVMLFLVASAAASEDAVKRIAERLKVGERTIRLDLDAIRDEVDAPSLDVLPPELLDAIHAADSFRLLKALGKRVMAEMVQGTLTRELGLALIDALREQRHALRAMRDEQGHAALKALEILTPKEREVLIAYRTTLVPKALKPGEFPAPPEGAEPPKPSDPAKPSGEEKP